MDKGIVEFGLSHVRLKAIYVLQGSVGVEGDAVRTESHDLAVFLVQSPKL